MKDKYIAANYYMLRSPLHTTNFSKKYNDIEDSLEEIKKDLIFNEQLLVASPSLYKMIHTDDFNKLSNKKKRNLIYSILSYQNRASYRTTPFGLFTGVELKKVNEKTDNSDKVYIKKHCRVDIEWLILLIKKIENENYKLLKYKLNTAYYKFGDRVYIPYNTGSNCEEISIIYRKPFQIVEKLCEYQLISYSEIINILKEEYPDKNIEVFDNYLNKLIKKEYLISELRPSLCGTNELQHIIDTINNYNTLENMYGSTLADINKLIKAYENTRLGEGIDVYKCLYKKMCSLFDHKKNTFLQIDCELVNLKNSIDDKDLNVINKFLNYTFSIMSTEDSNKAIKDYAIKFQEKYGEYLEVPIYELIDESTGIGAPTGYQNSKNRFIRSDELTDANNKLKRYFLERYSQAVKSNSCIQLDEDQLNLLEDDIKNGTFPDSLELNIIPKVKNGEKLLYLGPNVGSAKAGKTFGRFGYLSSTYSKAINDMSISIPKEDEIKCELSFIPSSIRIGNVIRSISTYAYNICCYTNSYNAEKEIKLKNILVGYNNGKFYLRDSKSGKKIKVFMTNMLNTTLLPNVLRLLVDISYDSNLMMQAPPWERYYDDFTYIPKIKYKNIIVSDEKWKISNYGLNLKDKNDYDEFLKSFIELKNKLLIPDRVYYEVADNRLLLNLNEEKYLKLLFYYFKKNPSVELQKVDEGDYVNFNSDGYYNTEIVIPFIRNKKDQTTNLNFESDKNIIKRNTKIQKSYLPFEDWLYFKLYGSFERQEELIDYLNYFVKSSKNVETFYFMRYVDPKPHIRIRFKGDKNTLFSILKEMDILLKDLKKRNIIYNIVIDTYIPEIERYGGKNLMEYAENIFCEDSKIVMNIISNFDIKKEEIKYGVISVLQYLNLFNLSFEEQFKFLKNSFEPSEYLDDFRKVRSEYIHDCDSYNGWKNLKKNDDYKNFLQILDERKGAVFNYCNKFSKSKEHTNDYEDIIGSIIHLHCNRLFGINRELEKKILNYSCRVLHGQEYMKNQLNKNFNNSDNEKGL